MARSCLSGIWPLQSTPLDTSAAQEHFRGELIADSGGCHRCLAHGYCDLVKAGDDVTCRIEPRHVRCLLAIDDGAQGRMYGIGVSANTITASLTAIISAMNRRWADR